MPTKKEALLAINKALKDNGVPYRLGGGTLLGATRDKDLLPWDNDFDLGIIDTYEDKVLEVIGLLGLIPHFKIVNNCVAFHYKDCVFQFYFMTKVANNYHWEDSCDHRLADEKFFNELQEIKFLEHDFYVPNHVEEYLTLKYQDWKIPNNPYKDKLYSVMKPEDVYTSGAFDLFHRGHLNILKKAKSLGGRLIVGVSTDRVIREEKKVKPYYSFEDRVNIVSSIKGVDIVIPEYEGLEPGQTKRIHKLGIRQFVKGDDFKPRYDNIAVGTDCKVIYFPYTKGVSTTNLKEKICE